MKEGFKKIMLFVFEMDFKLNHHGDVIISIEEKCYNLGYHSIFSIPVMLWLSNLQLGAGNLFQKMQLPNHEAKIFSDNELEDILRRGYFIAKQIPFEDVKKFNAQTSGTGIARCSGGIGNRNYKFKLVDKILEFNEVASNQEERVILKLKPADSERFAEDYVKFVVNEPQMAGNQEEIMYLALELKKWKS